MKAWVLGGPEEMFLVDKPVPQPAAAEVLVRVDAVAICATDLEILRHGVPAMVEGGLPFNKNFTIGHEYMGTVVKLGPAVDEYRIGDRVTVEVHAGCGRCERCRQGMYTSCLNYGDVAKGHRANGFTTDGGFAEYAVNHVNTLVHVPDDMTDEEATLVVTAGTSMYGLDVLGGLIAGEGVVVTGPGPIGLLGVAVAKALGAEPVILTGTRDARLGLGTKLGADHVINARRGGPGRRGQAHHRGQRACTSSSNARARPRRSTRRRRWSTAAAGSAWPRSRRTPSRWIWPIWCATTSMSSGFAARARAPLTGPMALMKQKRFDARLIHTHTFPLDELPTALRYARERIEDAIKVVVKAGV